MGLTLKSDDKGVMIFAKEQEGEKGKYMLYSAGVSSKDLNKEYVNGYISVRFKKGVNVPNKTKIKINNAFPVVTKSGERAYVSWMITDFESLEKKDEWVDMSNIKDDELPFAD